MMKNDTQLQKAGDNAQQIQAQTIVVNYGITEERAKELFGELSAAALKENTFEGLEIANKRIEQFAELVLPRIQRIEKDFESFTDPSFQILMKKAQVAAACSEREFDFNLLSELIAHRINNKTNIKKKASVEKAVEVIDKIDNDALCGLTMFHAMKQFVPVSGIITEGLKVIDELYSKCQYAELPHGQDWLDNLDILGAIRISPFGNFTKFEDYLIESWDGYVCVGISKDSKEYTDCCEELNSCGLNEKSLVDNELLEGYVRLPILGRTRIEKLYITPADIPITSKQKDALYKIFDKYSQSSKLLEDVKSGFRKKLLSFEHIKVACEWWNSLSLGFSIKSVGRAIAHANAKRIDNTLPDID